MLDHKKEAITEPYGQHPADRAYPALYGGLRAA